jgi:hypothetical protein
VAADDSPVPGAAIRPAGKLSDQTRSVRSEYQLAGSDLLRVSEPRQLPTGLRLGQDEGPSGIVMGNGARVRCEREALLTRNKVVFM